MRAFARFLPPQRVLRVLGWAAVAGDTRLSPTAIRALESDRFDELPARVFVIGYLRAYARCVGLGPDELVARYDEWRTRMGLDVEEPAPAPPARRMHERAATWPWIAGGCAVAATLWWLLA